MNFNLYLNPGPRDDSLLYLGDEHRARSMFLNPDEGGTCQVDIKRGDASFWELVYGGDIVMSPKVIEYVTQLGFGGVLRCQYRKVDRALIEALVERWRPETNTFHLPFGEVTVTLEDVNILWGLPIEGVALAGVEGSYEFDQRREMCLTYLGFDTSPSDYKSHMVKVSTMLHHMVNNPVSDDSGDEICMQRARCISLILASRTILPDTNNHLLSLRLLSYLTNVRTSGQHSWGGAALACLYRELYKGTKPDTKAIGGPMSLLQLWAWTRISTLAPTILEEEIDWRKPYGARWAENTVSRSETPSHVLKAHRTTLQNLRESDFDWMPYRDVFANLHQMCKTGSQSWRSRCYLIYWSVIEYHPVERVMRQFGLLQDIPAPFPLSRNELTQLRKTLRRGRLYTDWAVHHGLYVEFWNRRRLNVVEGVLTNTPTTHQTYNDWFHRHTVLYIKDPRHDGGVLGTGFHDHGGTSRYLMDGLGYIREEAIRMRNMGPDHYFENFGGVQDMASQLIGSINHVDQPTYIQTNPVNFEVDNTIPQHAQRGRGRRARQPTRRNPVLNFNNDNNNDDGEGTQQMPEYGEGTSHSGRQMPEYGEGTSHSGRQMPEYGEGTSHSGRQMPNYGAGTSYYGGQTEPWGEGYRPSFHNFGQGSSNLQFDSQINDDNNPNNSWMSSLFDYTPNNNMIPGGD